MRQSGASQARSQARSSLVRIRIASAAIAPSTASIVFARRSARTNPRSVARRRGGGAPAATWLRLSMSAAGGGASASAQRKSVSRSSRSAFTCSNCGAGGGGLTASPTPASHASRRSTPVRRSTRCPKRRPTVATRLSDRLPPSKRRPPTSRSPVPRRPRLGSPLTLCNVPDHYSRLNNSRCDR